MCIVRYLFDALWDLWDESISPLTHWDQDKMIDTCRRRLQILFFFHWNLFFLLKSHWSLFSRVQMNLMMATSTDATLDLDELWTNIILWALKSFESCTDFTDVTTCLYNDVIMSAMASQNISLTFVYSTFNSRRRSKKASKLRVTGF